MSLLEALTRAGLTTIAIIVIVSVIDKRPLWHPVIPGVVSFFAGYLSGNATIGALTFLVVYAVVAARHPLRRRQLEWDESLWNYRHQKKFR